MGLRIQTEGDTVSFVVSANPGAVKAGIRGLYGETLKIAVQSPPEKGKANQEIIALLAAQLKVAKNQISIVSGATARRKRIQISNCEPTIVGARLKLLL